MISIKNLLVIMLILSLSQCSYSEPSGAFCAEPIGAAISSIQKKRMDIVLDVFDKTEYMKKTYLYFSSFNEKLVGSSSLRSLVKQEYSNSPGFDKKILDLYGLMDGRFSKKELKDTMLNEVTKGNLIEENERFVYVNSNSNEFYNFANIDGVRERGASLQLNAEGFNAFFKDPDSMMGISVRERFSEIKPEIIIFDGLKPPTELVKQFSSDALVLYINGNIAHSHELKSTLELLREPDPSKTTFVNLLPRNFEDALQWGFDKEKAGQYAQAGKAFHRELAGSYLSETAPNSGKNEFLDALRTNINADRLTIVVGESSDNGRSLRIPGTADVVTKDDLSTLPKSENSVIFVACNSSEFSHELSPLSFLGTVYTKDALGFLRATFGKGSSDSISEYLDIPIDNTPFVKSLVDVANNLSVKKSSIDKSLEFYSIQTGDASSILENQAAGTVYQGAGENNEELEADSIKANPENQPSTINGTQVFWIVVVSIFGGLSREVFRWKRLIENDRHNRYLETKYIVISLLVILCGVGVALIFTKLITNTQYIYPVAFVCGVGVEKIVQLAAKLDIWVPNVPLGDEVGREESKSTKKDLSIIDYLSH